MEKNILKVEKFVLLLIINKLTSAFILMVMHVIDDEPPTNISFNKDIFPKIKNRKKCYKNTQMVFPKNKNPKKCYKNRQKVVTHDLWDRVYLPLAVILGVRVCVLIPRIDQIKTFLTRISTNDAMHTWCIVVLYQRRWEEDVSRTIDKHQGNRLVLCYTFYHVCNYHSGKTNKLINYTCVYHHVKLIKAHLTPYAQ